MCCYKTNYELYSDRDPSESRRNPPQAIANPLATLYPHVSALQTPYYHADFTTSEWYGDNTVGYWAGAYASPEAPEYKIDESRRGSDSSTKTTKIVTKLRRILRSSSDLSKRSCHGS
ncbi:hypothetical protein M432DRAFT_342904 [Thermoascus aurantiacus ATCC 26904]